MKFSNKSSIITGTVLLVLSALFSISLLLQLLNFGFGGSGNNIFYFLGSMFYAAYGFSSIIIPLFLFITGVSCFATKWTSQRTMRILTALVPFFTSVLTEKICRSIIAINSSSATTVKIIITVVTGVMLIIIEILGAGVIAESVNQKFFYKDGKPRIKGFADKDEKNNDEGDKDESVDGADDSSFGDDSETDDEADNSDNIFKYAPIKKNSVFDKSLSNLKLGKNINQEDESYNSLKEAANNLYEENIPSIDDYENLDKKDESDKEEESDREEVSVTENLSVSKESGNKIKISDEEKAAAFALAVNPATIKKEAEEKPVFVSASQTGEAIESKEASPESSSKADDDESEPANPASIITQEEYAALISSDEETPVSNAVEDELEWPDLPPAPASLPPDYLEEEDSDVRNGAANDDDDPALVFPPKDDIVRNGEEVARQNEAENLFEEAINAQKLTDEDEEDDEDEVSESESSDFPDETDETVDNEKNFDEEFADIQDAFDEEEVMDEDAANDEETSNENDSDEKKSMIDESEASKENPYSSARVIDTMVHRNPAYPYGITLHENTDEEQPPKKKPKPAAPKYPVKISLEENLTDMPYIPDIAQEYEIDEKENETEPNALDPDFYDIDMNSQEDDEELSDDIEEVAEELKPTNNVFKQLYSQESGNAENPEEDNLEKDDSDKTEPSDTVVSASPVASISSTVSDVFSDMEADIRRTVEVSAPVKTSDTASDSSSANAKSAASKNTVSVTTTANKNPLNTGAKDSPELNPNANTAKNLTADELTDFFNAQQAENTPKTQEIQGNPAKTNRAEKKGPYIIPSDLLTAYKDDQYWIIDEKTKEASINLKQTLSEFNIDAEIIGIKKGPVVTMFELLPAPGVKLSKIVALQDNIALSLAASSVRIVAPIPGKQAVGIEVPNKNRSIVSFREIIEMDLPEYTKMAVPVVLGKDILGKAQLIDLVKTPHMLIAGATGSGKSVCVNSLILSILYKRSYKDVKLILVDPKVVELKLYNNIPHLLTPVITEPKKALQALQYCLCEMERRYALLDGLGVRDISSYNQRIKERDICTEKLPYIVVIIDEFADLMATSGKELESIVARLTAMSRAVGIHLVLATQRPSVNVITGLIKANIPSRIAFMVASRTDSNIIIDSVGAEKLLGRGDMLYASAVDPYPVRIQGTFVSDSEVENVVEYVKTYGEPDYIDEEIFIDDDGGDDVGTDLFGNSVGDDPLYDQALEIVMQAGKASASYIQRRLKIGYNRAARLVEEMEERGIVGPANGSKPREIIHVP